MRLQHLGTDTKQGGSPALYLSDRGTYVIQGWRTDQSERIEIPHALLGYLREDTCLGALLHDTGHGTFLLMGAPLTDQEALNQLEIPGHETAVEVPVGEEQRPDALPARR
ncbi:MAG: uncharacterized protein JWN03_1880 [Nocardia sp.]|uniref:hypothetical protein n=1 Tax=Nocardia sp. TaxID=1821 RepID=UPI00261B7611|nr:hypothetical protein [Nocardia sp.]MCU1641605.1 uncharacterized protein [Nocardia sp.]